MMFDKTMATIDPKIPIWLEANASPHTLKDKHPLFDLYKSMGFEFIGPFTDAYAEKQWNEREEDGEDNSILGPTKEEQIANLKWDTALMINLRQAQIETPSIPDDQQELQEALALSLQDEELEQAIALSLQDEELEQARALSLKLSEGQGEYDYNYGFQQGVKYVLEYLSK